MARKPKDIDDDRGRRPALSLPEWQAKQAPAPTVKAAARPRKAAKPAAPRDPLRRVPVKRAAPVAGESGAPRKRAATNAERVRMVEPKTPPMPTSGGAVMPVSGPGGSVPGPSTAARRARIDHRAAAQEASAFANRQAYMAAHGKPSVVGRTAGGAAGGAAAGASIGGLPGAAVGAGLGAVGGGVGGARAKREYRRATREPNPAKKLLVAEFAVCALVAAMAPLADKKRDEPAGAWIKRMVAILGLFMVLGLVSAGGRTAAKVAAGFGGLVTVVLLMSQRDVFVKVAELLNKTTDQAPAGPGPTQRDVAAMSGGRQLGSTEVNPTGTGAGRKSTVSRRVQ